MVTIKEVGAWAGVSASTVSNVLNHRGHVAEATKEKVLEAVELLGYEANIHAQQLVTQRSRILAIKLPDLSEMGSSGIPNSSYFLNVVNGATAAANEQGYVLVVLPSQTAPQTLKRFGIDGFIVVDPRISEHTAVDGVPVVAIGASDAGADEAGLIDNDHGNALRIAMEQFQRKGRVNHAIVKDITHRPYITEIEDGYNQWASETGTPPTIFTLPLLSYEELAALVERIREMKIDAIYAVSDEIAISLLKVCQQSGVSVPDELSIISAVDSSTLNLTTPAISAIELFPLRTGREAANLLITALGDSSVLKTKVPVPVDYIERESV